jgi:hypothetical protein
MAVAFSASWVGQDWRVVTGAGALFPDDVDGVTELPVEDGDDVDADAGEGPDVEVEVDPDDAGEETIAACRPDEAVVVPIEPSKAITANASANVAAAVAATRRRISEMRRRRASRRALAIWAADSDVSGGGEVWAMAANLGAPCKRTLEGSCEVPEHRGRTVAQPILSFASGCSQRPARLSSRGAVRVLSEPRDDVRTPCLPSERCFTHACCSCVPPR